jgi:hypothetical protein
MGRADLIGPGKQHLVPSGQMTGGQMAGGGDASRAGRRARPQSFMTQHTRPARRPGPGEQPRRG